PGLRLHAPRARGVGHPRLARRPHGAARRAPPPRADRPLPPTLTAPAFRAPATLHLPPSVDGTPSRRVHDLFMRRTRALGEVPCSRRVEGSRTQWEHVRDPRADAREGGGIHTRSDEE